jgi:CrcB protein
MSGLEGLSGLERWLLVAALAGAGALGAVLRVAVTGMVTRARERLARRHRAGAPAATQASAEPKAAASGEPRAAASTPPPFPLGTLVVNGSGALAAGILAGILPGLAGTPGAFGATVAGWVLGVGLLGAFTTFSTWMVEVQARPGLPGLRYLAASLCVGVGAALVGVAAGGALFPPLG